MHLQRTFYLYARHVAWDIQTVASCFVKRRDHPQDPARQFGLDDDALGVAPGIELKRIADALRQDPRQHPIDRPEQLMRRRIGQYGAFGEGHFHR